MQRSRLALGLLTALLAAGGCESPPGDGANTQAVDTAFPDAPADPANVAADGPAGAAAPTISAEGIGEAMRGRTVGQLRAALPPSTRIGDPDDRYMVDLVGLPVIAQTDTLYVLLFGAGQVIDDATPLDYVATTHPAVKTAEGIGPGTTLEAAAAAYGPPKLSYNVNDESREYAVFEGQPPNILYRVAPASETAMFAGSYDTTGEYNETTRYQPRARIRMVLVQLTR